MLGRATILLMTSQGFLLVSGYVINVGLARLLGPQGFGLFGVVMSFLLVVQLFVITGIPIALQKFVAENIDTSRLLHRKILPWHLLYSVAVFGLFWFVAPVISDFLKDERLTYLLRIASFDILFYGLYKYYASIQNGLHEFSRQTITGIAYAVAKPVGTFTLIFLGYGVTGAIWGNTLGSIGGLLVGFALLRFPQVKGRLAEIPFFKFAFTNVFYFVGLQLLFSIDIWVVKYYLSEDVVGQYVSAASVAKIPYFLSLAVSSALLPSISRATKERDEKRVRDIIRITLRYWFMLLFGMIVVVGSTAPALVVLFFGTAYAAAGPVLGVLFSGVALLTFAAVMNTILISRDSLASCLVVVACLILVHATANAFLVPQYGAMGAANATLLVGVLATVLSGALLLNKTRVLLPALSALKTVAAAGAILALANYLPLSALFLLARCVLLAAGFVLLLFLLRELNVADLKRLRAVLIPGQ